jgi:uridine kinase
MHSGGEGSGRATIELAAQIRARARLREGVAVVAIDGRSGAGKSTLAAAVAERVGATVVPSDDFFAASITDTEWEAKSPEQRAADAIDWKRLRRDALVPLRAGKAASWFAFDFVAGKRTDGSWPLKQKPTEQSAAPIVIVDGAYSSRPELADLIDLTVLIQAPALVRQARIAAREDPSFLMAWHARWDAAENHYFRNVRPPTSFELVYGSGEDG